MRMRFRAFLLPVLCLAAMTAACSRSKDISVLGTFQLGDRVQAGPLLYQASETEWRTDLGSDRVPKDRFLLVKMSIENTGNRTIAVPGFELRSADGKSYQEVMERVEKVDNWLGMLRSVEPGKKIQGYAVFDVPVGAYSLAVSDAGDVANEKHALIKIPVEIHENP